MNLIAQIGGIGELQRHARIARELGSPFVSAVLEAAHRNLDRAPRTAALIAHWQSDPAASALAMRFNGALHALARRGSPPELAALYHGKHEDYDRAIGDALSSGDDFIAEWMRDPPQTNEVGRAASISAALMVARHRFDLPFELLELGSSCGLNLNLARYGYTLGGAAAGVQDSPVQIAPCWQGPSPVIAPIEVVCARGVDLNPLDARAEWTRERLLSYVWADQPRRAGRLEAALSIAQEHPPRLDKADARTWLSEQLALPQQRGVCRVVFHSMVLQYLQEVDRAAILQEIAEAGARARDDTPLAWIAFEWTPARSEVQLTLTCWPRGETQLLAICHPYGDWIEWKAEGRAMSAGHS